MNYSETKTVIDLSDAQNISELGLKITTILDSEGAINKELFLNLGDIDLKQSQLLSIKALIETMQSKLVGVQTTSEMTKTAAIGLGLVVGDVQKHQTTSAESITKAQVVDNDSELTSFSQLKRNSVGDMVTNTDSLTEVESENPEEETNGFLSEKSLSDNDDTEGEIDINNSDLFKNNTNIYEEPDANVDKSDEIQSALDITFGTNAVSENANKIINEEINSSPSTIFGLSEPAYEDREVTETVEKADDGKYILLDTEGITPEGVELIKSNTSDMPTLYLTQTLRSGQTVSYEGNIFLIGDAHPGSEIIATGDVTIWGILGGIVHAGSKGNLEAKVRALKLNPIQLRIANLYSRRNDTVNVPFVQRTNEFTPEEARIENEQIVIYKTLRRED